MSLIVISSPRFAEHQNPPGHPERSERAEVMDVVADAWRRSGGEVVAPRAATSEVLGRVHDSHYLKRIAETAGASVALDPDTFTSPETYEVALLAAGAAVEGVERVIDGRRTRALALVRPPGHHAERDRAMGFCFYNNVAVGAAHARALGVERVAIVDYDVHHGNGTQHTFEDDPHVLYVSTHQSPFYPGTGEFGEVGRGDGRGFTINVPLDVGAVDEDYRLVYAEIVLPILGQFRPGLVMVSAGFDAHERDPLGGMRLTSAAFAAMTMELRRVAESHSGGRMMAITEGGYDLHALAECLQLQTGALGPEKPPATEWPKAGTVRPTRGRSAVAAAKSALSSFWRL
jgi:acetoin utilization deacetylase AcuC-like enzyme